MKLVITLLCSLSLIFGSLGYTQIIDPCFTSPSVSTTFASTANVHGNNSDCLEWTGATWIGDWPWANITLAPPGGTPGTRAIWAGDGSVWTTGGEGFGLRLATPISTGTIYNYNFTRVSHGQGSTGSFSPTLYTNSGGSFGYNVGSIPTAGSTWFTGIISFTAVPAQNGHSWIYFHTQNGGIGSGMFLACETPILPMEFQGFRGWHESGRNQIEWQITNDIDYASHRIERSTDGSVFHGIGTINSKKNHETSTYNFQDVNLSGLEKKAFYRIVSIHENAGEAISPVLEVSWTGAEDPLLNMYPNPVHSGQKLHIEYMASEDGSMEIGIIDISGRRIYATSVTGHSGINQISLQLPQLEKGVYQVILSTTKKKTHYKLLVN